MKKIVLLLTLAALTTGASAQSTVTQRTDSLTTLAKAGNMDAMLALGDIYFLGEDEFI